MACDAEQAIICAGEFQALNGRLTTLERDVATVRENTARICGLLEGQQRAAEEPRPRRPSRKRRVLEITLGAGALMAVWDWAQKLLGGKG